MGDYDHLAEAFKNLALAVPHIQAALEAFDQYQVPVPPASWDELLAALKVHQPLEARKLEDVEVIFYSRELIVVRVCEQGIIGPMLLRPDYQAKLECNLRKVCHFHGRFIAIAD